jgi:hypothetical protein
MQAETRYFSHPTGTRFRFLYRRQALQREHLPALLGADGDTVGDRMRGDILIVFSMVFHG